jgi:uncharacterized protein YbjT (DUF2867 family)
VTIRLVTVFGGIGFLGRRIVQHLHKREFCVRVASRHPERSQRLFGMDDPRLQSVEANVRDERSVATAIAGTDAVINAVSLYVERGDETFNSVHIESAQRVRLKRNERGSIISSMFRGSAPTLAPDHFTFASAAKAN